MANTTSAKKALRQNISSRAHNKDIMSSVRTYAKKVETEILTGSHETAMKALKLFEKNGMKAVSKGIFHINTIARRISRLYARIKKLKVA